MARTETECGSMINNAPTVHKASFREYLEKTRRMEAHRKFPSISQWLDTLPEGEAEALWAQFLVEKETS